MRMNWATKQSEASAEDAMEEVDSILLIQRRYHTNQHPITATFLDEGHEVNFLALDSEQSEEYGRLRPDMVKFSPIFLLVYSFLSRFHVDIDQNHIAIPSPLWYYRYLRKVDPDIIVVKKYFAISFATVLYAKLLGVNLVFYDQQPLYDDCPFYVKRRIIGWVYYLLHNERFVRYTPVLGNPDEELAIPRSYYIPFVAPPDTTPIDQSRESDSAIRIMMVGKLRSRRKNHLMLVRAVGSLVEDYDVTLTLVGSLSSPTDSYYRELVATVNEVGIGDRVEIKRNLPYQTVQDEYGKHDLYVLPSKSEPAAVSPLEAMNCGLPVVCSETNGTSCYIQEGVNGFLVDPRNQSELTKTVERIVSSEQMRRAFGRSSRYLARTQYSSERFYSRFSWLVRENFQ